ncbi:MAG: glucose-1-phosphate adenylyltransferase subunit GlgD [Clostridia bacterium]
MLDTMGIIFADKQNKTMGELTKVRSVAALPIAGRYRLIDFILSGMVNSGIINIGLLTNYNYQSILDHVGSGKPWNLARKNYGLFILPPFANKSVEDINSRISLLYGAFAYIHRSKQKYVVLADSDNICNITFDDIFSFHKENGADVTVVYKKENGCCAGEYYADVDGIRITKVRANESKDISNRLVGYYIMERELLINLLERSIGEGKKDFVLDLIGESVTKLKVCAYEYKGYLNTVNSVNKYFDVCKDLLNREEVREELFGSANKILTKVMDKVPCRYLSNAKVTTSFIADGCIIDGAVSDTILFRGVKIGKGSVISNCVIMQNTEIGENVTLTNCILDKNCVVHDGKSVIGTPDKPIVAGKRITI